MPAVLRNGGTYGKKFFELSNHLGNVMAVISDKRVPINSSYDTELISSNDYYAFGGQMPGRSSVLQGATGYRYGFNGKENDNEVKGLGNQQDYGMRIYDARIGKFLSVDPITANYPMLTPYQFAGNMPIEATDLDGLEPSHTAQKGDCEGCKIEALKDGDYLSDVQDQKFTLKMRGVSQAQFDKFKNQMSLDPGKIINNNKAKYNLVDRDGSYGVTKNDHFDIDIFPDNGSVVVSNVTNSTNYLSVTVKTLEGHPDAGQNTFTTMYDPKTSTMTWQTNNISRSNDFVTQGIGAGMFRARAQQQKQWRNVMSQVYKYLGKPVIQVATQTIAEYDYNDYKNKVGKLESKETKDVSSEIKK
jgi:RHS repeat-associated protein